MIHTFACISKKFWSLLPMNQNVCLAKVERIQKEVKTKGMFPVSCQLNENNNLARNLA